MISKNHLVLSIIISICTQSTSAYHLPDYLGRLGKKTLSLQHLCMYAIVHPYVLDYVHQQVQDDIVWQKSSIEVNKHDLCDLGVSMLLEICYALLCGLREDQLQEHIVLSIYGALLHKCLQQILCVCGLHNCMSDKRKQQYCLYGSNYVKALLACMCSEYADPTKYT